MNGSSAHRDLSTKQTGADGGRNRTPFG